MGYFVASGMTRVRNRAARQAHRGLLVLLGVALIAALAAPGLAISRVTAQDGASGDAPMFRGNPARTASFPVPGRTWASQSSGTGPSRPAALSRPLQR